jgi:hypothetical protein
VKAATNARIFDAMFSPGPGGGGWAEQAARLSWALALQPRSASNFFLAEDMHVYSVLFFQDHCALVLAGTEGGARVVW